MVALGSSIVVFAFASWLIILDARSRLHRAFSLFLFILAMTMLLFVYGVGATDYFGRVRFYFLMALPFAAAHFLNAYFRKYGRHAQRWTKLQRVIPFALVAAYALSAWANATEKSLNNDGLRPGPLTLLVGMGLPVLALCGLVFAKAYRREPDGRHRQSLFYLSLGFTFYPFHDSLFRSFAWVLLAANDPATWGRQFQSWIGPFQLTQTIALVLSAWTVAAMMTAPTGRPEDKRRIAVAFGALSLVTMAAAILFSSTPTLNHFGTDLNRGAHSAGVLLLPLLSTYAMVRYRLFDIDYRARWALVRALLGLFFIFVFILAAQLAETYLGTTQSWISAGVVSALFIFLLYPLQRWAERFANHAMPEARHVNSLNATERRSLYQEQARLAWRDGSLSVKERRMLDAMRQRLGISLETAAKLEGAALGDPGPESGSPRARRARKVGA